MLRHQGALHKTHENDGHDHDHDLYEILKIFEVAPHFLCAGTLFQHALQSI